MTSTARALAPSVCFVTTVLIFLCSDRVLEAAVTDPHTQGADLFQWSLEELGRIKVTSVSKKSENLSSAAAAIHVITQEDLRRSGVDSLPEALRMAPGLDVARASSRQWAISSRGFNNVFANKLLVLLDGRTIYTPLFSGVFWEETDTVLEDVDRIEVIRGPGATLWGANAVNGVINIISKGAKDTPGLLITGGGGIEERGFGTVRYGGQLASNVHYRVYTKYSDRDDFTQTDGRSAEDSWWMSQGGFRMDWAATEASRMTLQGDYYYGDLGSKFLVHSLTPPGLFLQTFRSKVEGGNLLGRWAHELSDESDLTGQVFYDRTDRGFGPGREIRDTLDLEAQHRFHPGDRHEIVWGGGYRFSTDDITQSADFQMHDPKVGLQLVSGFVQDEIALVPDRLHLTAGTKVEYHDFTGFEVQPSGRVAWTPHDRHTFWAAVSRAVRTPSRAERGFGTFADPLALLPPLPLPVLAPGMGNPDFGSEELIAYEIGYRAKVHSRLTLDWTAFYNVYDRLQSATILSAELRNSPGSPPTPYLYLPLTFRNDLFGETYGIEISATWHPADFWRLRANYTFLRMQLHTPGPARSFTEDTEGSSPQHQVSLWSDLDLGRHFECGVGVRYVDDLPAVWQQVPGYAEMEARLAWKPSPHSEFSLVSHNLFHAHHREFSPTLIINRNVQVDRAVYAKLTLRF